ncbi:MAG: hydroxyacylglutathione hydrolase C-terminal domain-containing protein [Hyphomonas sp.]
MGQLSKLEGLPPATTIYCAHEYTQIVARFAETIEPGNEALMAYVRKIDELRAKGIPTVPTSLERELATNPFLRADVPALQAAMGHPGDAVATFAETVGRKDRF